MIIEIFGQEHELNALLMQIFSLRTIQFANVKSSYSSRVLILDGYQGKERTYTVKSMMVCLRRLDQIEGSRKLFVFKIDLFPFTSAQLELS